MLKVCHSKEKQVQPRAQKAEAGLPPCLPGGSRMSLSSLGVYKQGHSLEIMGE